MEKYCKTNIGIKQIRHAFFYAAAASPHILSAPYSHQRYKLRPQRRVSDSGHLIS